MKNLTLFLGFGLVCTTCSAGVVDDVLKFQDRLEANRRVVVCASLQKDLEENHRQEKKIIAELKTEETRASRSETIELTYRLLNLTHIRIVLEEQIKLNTCGGKK